jgi:NADH:ubiquinone oxidoreductase subunit 6 (subunit J)
MEIAELIIIIVLVAIAVVIIVLFATGALSKGGEEVVNIFHWGKPSAAALLNFYIAA